MESKLSSLIEIPLKDIADILVITFIIYQVLRLIQGTRAWQMTLGVVSLVIFYYGTRVLDLRTVQWLLENFFPYFVFSLIVAFSSEIRRGLAELGKRRLIQGFKNRKLEAPYEEIVLAATTLSSQKIGALIVVEGDIGLKNYIESGIRLDAHVTYDLLLTIFSPQGPLHDGAVVVVGDRIAAAACFLPLTTDPYLSKELGTRHRAAIGITEETDAIAVVVSEETGKISAVSHGEITRNLDGPRLMRILELAVSTPVKKGKTLARKAVQESEEHRRQEAS